MEATSQKAPSQNRVSRSISFRRRTLRKVDRAARITGRSRSDCVDRAVGLWADEVLKANKRRTDTLTGRSA